MKNTIKKILLVAGLCCFGWSQFSQAAPIQGTIDFGGVITFNTMSLATATTVNTWNTSFVQQSSGDFSSIAQFTSVAMAAPWIFNSGTPGSPSPGPATPTFWSVGGFTFDLSSSMIVSQSTTFLNVTGIGTIRGNGFDPTPGTWSFTASRGDGSPSMTFGFQSQTAAVPEANSIALVGLASAFLVVGKLSRRKRIKV